ncbi:hypothetical protein CR513_01937, partial [Mucuna pruriens]
MTWRSFHWWNQLHQMAQPKPTRLNPSQPTLCIEDNARFKCKFDETAEAITSILERDDPCLKGTKLLGPKRQVTKKWEEETSRVKEPNSLQAEARKTIISPYPWEAEEPWNCLRSESKSSVGEA